MPAAFVTADWLDLVVASYAVPEAMVLPRIPQGLTIDHYDGECYVSVVGFRFERTRMLGLPLPIFAGIGSFPQWNLRTYVRCREHLGVVFVREFVPSPITALIVSAMYKEPYHAAPLTCRVTSLPDLRRVRYDLQAMGGHHTLAVTAEPTARGLEPGSLAEFFLRQGSGCGVDRRGDPVHFVVEHADWEAYPVREYQVTVDFAALYGEGWSSLNGRTPDSVLICAGSRVSVSNSMKL